MAEKEDNNRSEQSSNYHYCEARRIQNELDNLGPGFSKDGPVRTGLRHRITQEYNRANLEESNHDRKSD